MNFEFKCPQCGQMVEADEAYRGQVAECPHCGKGIVIPRIRMPVPPLASKADRTDNSEIQNAHNSKGIKWKMKRDPELQQSVKTSNAPGDSAQTLLEWWKGSGPVQKLIVFLWSGIVLDAISCIIGLFDVREYYALGRVTTFVFKLLFLLIDTWLVIAISRRKSWARKLNIILGLLGLVFIVWNFNEFLSDNSLIALIDLLSLGISAFCVIMCFSKEVRDEFLPDAMLKGPKAIVNRYQCIAYIAVIIVYFVGSCLTAYIIGTTYYGSAEWVSNCTEAAALGSESARNDLIEKLTDEYVAELPEQSQEDEVQIAILKKRAKRECDALIKSHSKYSKSRKGTADTSRSRIVDFLLSKGIAKILVVIFVACASALGQKFARKPTVISMLTIVIGSIIFVTIRYNKYSRESVPEPSNSIESEEDNSEDIEAHPKSTEKPIPIPVIKNSDGVYDWQSMCQKEWPEAFLEIQRVIAVFGGFQLAQPPIDGFKLRDINGRNLVGYNKNNPESPLWQDDIPLQKKYRYFQKANLEFLHGALINFTLKAYFPKKYSMASVDREYKALQNDITENLKRLNKPYLGIGLEKDGDWTVVVYGQQPSPGIHKIVGGIYVTANLEQDDDGCYLNLSVESDRFYYSYGLKKFIESVVEKDTYEAGEELEGFDKKQQSGDESTNTHQSSTQARKPDERKTEEAETRSARTETPVPSPTISVPTEKEGSPNLPDESTDSLVQTVVRQSSERKAEDTETPSTKTETPTPTPTISEQNEKESAFGQSPPVRTNKVVKITGFGNYKFGQKYLAARMTAEMWQEGGLAIKPVQTRYRKFRTLELGYAIDGKQLCRIKLCAEFPSNTDDKQLSDELMKVKGEIERQLGLEMTGHENEANYEDEKYVVKLWHQPTTKTVYSTKHVGFRKHRIANTTNIKCLYLLLEDKRLMPK